MKKIFTYMALVAVAVLTACSDSDIALSSNVTDSLDKYSVTGTMVSNAEFEGGRGDDDQIRSKSQLYYDRISGGNLKFTWTVGDKIGIFPESDDDSQFAFVLDNSTPLTVQGNVVTGVFEPDDKGAVYPIEKTTTYYSYFPYKEQDPVNGNFTYRNVPINFRGQTQTANEQMDCYWQALYGKESEKEANSNAFLKSEQDAAAHLPTYDYMVSTVASTEAAHVHFMYSNLTSVVRFYIYSPEPAYPGLFVDSLQVVNNSREFTLDAEMDLTTKQLHPSATSRVMSLRFSPAIDMTNNSDNTKETYHYWDREYPENGYIMAYMMMAPIDLTAEGVENSTLYMIARQPKYYTTATEYNSYYGLEVGNDGYLANNEALKALKQAEKMKVYKDVSAYNAAKDPDISQSDFDALPVDKKLIDPDRKVYKATLSKINFLAGKHYQWVSALNSDSPITFEEISIETWKTGTEFTNADGTGTEDW